MVGRDFGYVRSLEYAAVGNRLGPGKGAVGFALANL